MLEKLKENWPSAFVARSEVGRFTGGILNPRSAANNDSRGTGVEGRIRIGRKVAYPVDSLIRWLEERSQQL